MMRSKITLALSLAVIFFLVGCNNSSSTSEYFLTHPEKIAPTFVLCTENVNSAIRFSNECKAVFNAIPIFRAYLVELVENPALFGVNLMHEEYHLVELKKNYQTLRSKQPSKDFSELRRAIALAQLKVESRLSLLRLVYKMHHQVTKF